MVTKSSDASSKSKDGLGTLRQKILQLEKQIKADRILSIKEKLQENSKKLEGHVSKLLLAARSKPRSNDDASSSEKIGSGNMLSSRIENPLWKYGGTGPGIGDKDYVNCQDVVHSTSVKLPLVESIPPYTTWIFLDRNQRMAEDQSVVGRRRIYYDQHDSEALVCSDSEEEITEPEEDKHEFSHAEDQILWIIAEENGLGEEVLNILTQFIGGTNSEILERYSVLKGNHQDKLSQKNGLGKGIYLDKSLSASLDSFDNLFCRRCLVFDCRLHGCSQGLINSSEKQSYSSESEEDRKPCGDQCHIQLSVKELLDSSDGDTLDKTESKISEEERRNPISVNAGESDTGKRKASDQLNSFEEDLTLISNDCQSSSKKQKMSLTPEEDNIAAKASLAVDSFNTSSREQEVIETNKDKVNLCTSNLSSISSGDASDKASELVVALDKEEVNNCEWKPLEKELYLKGVEIFGRNCCLIARNLLSGLKTCIEVSRYMHDEVAARSHRSVSASNSFLDDDGKADADKTEHKNLARSRLFRRRGKTRKLKYSWKSAGNPSFWRRIADGKDQSCKQYIPCGCQSVCGKECPCLVCEKYCGCSKSCKTRFRGCHCAKSQCRSRQCPCFAAGRECDPDVCRNCWVRPFGDIYDYDDAPIGYSTTLSSSCGDGSLGEPPRRGDGQCGNMRLLLRQQQRILLSKSDVAGWGAFLKNPVNKNEYLGEYTGELISHREADKRGKIYDRANSSFLFDLNDQYVLDAYRKGDKLKFANHSSNPNCFAKVMLVAGDHRVGIFANERIEASEELFYDYRYGPDQAPEWARKPDGSKGDDHFSNHQGRAKKHQSH